MASPPLDDEDALVFAEEEAPAAPPAPSAVPWLVLIVDDEPEVHTVTRLALADFSFRGRELRLLSAYSAAEAKEALAANQGVAAILLDVVMESEQAGLELVRHIRTVLNNAFVRIILRTGQAGQAPERTVIIEYDINDYKEKSELTAPRLFTALVTALRAYEDLMTIEANRLGLHQIIAASASLFVPDSLDAFLGRVLAAFNAIFRLGGDTLVCVRHQTPDDGAIRIVDATGTFVASRGQRLEALARADVRAVVQAGLDADAAQFPPGGGVFPFRSHNHHQGTIYVDGSGAPEPIAQEMIEIFCAEAAIGLDNVYLYEQLRRSEAATVLALAKAAEFKDENTSAHLRRVCALSQALARILFEKGCYPDVIDAEFVRLIGLASVLHDVGKVGIPDRVLQKQGPLDDKEWQIMRRHPLMSEAILEEAARMVDGETYLSLGATLAAAHHERFDGGGYPRGLAGDAIPVAARIMAVVDVFDALTTERAYKPAWPAERALEFLRAEAGKRFDPVMTEAFIAAVARGDIAMQEITQMPCDPLATSVPGD